MHTMKKIYCFIPILITQHEVGHILDMTATKIDTYTFSETPSRPNGTWNNEVGYGLVNCYDAVSMAYYNNADNYLNLIEFDFSEFILDMRITAEDDIAIIWDWETKDITYINASASEPKDTTISHIFTKTGMKHIVIAETLAPGETPTAASDALTELDGCLGLWSKVMTKTI